MAFTPLTREQYQKQIDAGFTPDKILEFEKRRKSESQAQAPNKIASPIDTSRFTGEPGGLAGAVRGVIAPVVQTIARPIQLAQSLLTGKTPEYNVPTLVGGIKVADPNKETQPIKKAFGRAAETVSFGLGPVAGGAAFAGGAAAEQGKGITGIAGQTVLGGFLGKATDLALDKAAPYLFKQAMDIYQSALKPSTTLSAIERSKVLQTGIKEAIVLSEGGVKKTAQTIDNLESQLGQAIDKAAGITRDDNGNILSKTGQSAMIEVSKLKPFIEEVKNIFGKTTDVAKSDVWAQQLDDLYTNFANKYGEKIPVEIAQELKTNTYKVLRDSYGELSGAVVEGNKQLVRGLKEGIVKVAPMVEGINDRLSALYKFDKILNRASGRIGNLNLLGLGTKILAAGAGSGTVKAAITLLSEISGPMGKSISAIGLDRIGSLLEKITPEERQIILNLIRGTQKSVTAPTTIQTDQSRQ